MNDIVPRRALPTSQEAQALQSNFDAALDYYMPQIADALPEHIPLARFKRVLITAINQDRELYSADRQSLFNACVKCAQDGLYPDGREAVLKVFNTKVKRRDASGIEREVIVAAVTYMPMVAGLRKRLRNSGEVLSSIAEVVYRNDKFRYLKGEDARIEHEPAPLDKESGDPVGAYAIIKLANGEVLREVMSAQEIEHIRKQFSRGSDTARSPWVTSRGEMWRKTVLRRCSKAAPMDSEMRRLLERDDEPAEAPAEVYHHVIPPRPARERLVEVPPEEDKRDDDIPLYELTDVDGEIVTCTADLIEANLTAIFDHAKKRGDQALEAALENNAIFEEGVAPSLTHEFETLRAYLHREPEPEPEPEPAPPPRRQRQSRQNPAGDRRAESPATVPHGGLPQAAGIVPSREIPSYEVPLLKNRDGSPAYRAWWIDRFIPNLLALKTADEVQKAIDANVNIINGFFATLAPPTRVAHQKQLDDIQSSFGH